MKLPQPPPNLDLIPVTPADLARFRELVDRETPKDTAYLHWDELRWRTPPGDLTHEQWWLWLKLGREPNLRAVPLQDKNGRHFRYALEDNILKGLHEIDMGAGGQIAMPGKIANQQSSDRYLVRSLMEEAITSSQLEGAATTREVAKEMIRTGRRPRDKSERMVLNNYLTMQHIRRMKDEPLTPQAIMEIHRTISQDTLDDPAAAGRLRRADEKIAVYDGENEVLHDPPPVEELPRRMQEMCDFANGKTPDFFIHPVVRAMILHFWLAYDHPFVDGNGRTARALFYWAMLHNGYWLFEFVSISSILYKAPVQYGRSFLYTETDDNDLTYFLIAQTKVILQAIEQLHEYIARKTAEVQELESSMRSIDLFNHRQVALLRHALKHPGHRYTITGHQTSHNVVYQTARTDLLGLADAGLLIKQKRGKGWVFSVPPDLASRLSHLDKDK
jgi:Fic family protein